MANKLILRTNISPYSNDITKGSVLSWNELDSNFINTKGLSIFSGATSGTSLTFRQLNGDDISIPNANIYLTGASFSANTIMLDRNDGINIPANLTIPTEKYYISASGTSEYTGVTSGTSLTSIEEGIIYQVIFKSGNTNTSGTSVTIDIDNIGPIPIKKFDNGDPVDLVAGEIQANFIYFLAYDGTQFQLSIDEPIFTPLTYTRLTPVQIAVGGVPVGATFNDIPYNQVFDQLFSQQVNAVINNFRINSQTTVLEVGQPIVSGNKTFYWYSNSSNIVSGSTNIYRAATILASGITTVAGSNTTIINFPTNIVYTHPTYARWTLKALRTNGSLITLYYNIYWRHRLYYGTSSASTLTDTDILSLSGTSYLTTVPTHAKLSYGAGGYKYFIVPASFANPNLFKDYNTNLAIAMAGTDEGYNDNSGGFYNYQLVSVTNTFGVTTNYKVYRSKNVLGGQIKITII